MNFWSEPIDILYKLKTLLRTKLIGNICNNVFLNKSILEKIYMYILTPFIHETGL